MSDTSSPPRRQLGRSGISVSALGLGCWAIGGVLKAGEAWESYGEVDDAVSTRAILAALDRGITLFDTADAYGAGHSERLLGAALGKHRKEAVISTKFGSIFDEEKRLLTGEIKSAAEVRASCEASLRRLKTEWIDLYLFHLGDWPVGQVGEILVLLQDLVAEGKIRSFGWSTDDPERAAAFTQVPGCAAFMYELNVLHDSPDMLALCDRTGMASMARGPLAMGLLSGKYDKGASFGKADLRGGATASWIKYFVDGQPAPAFLEATRRVREILCAGGRTPAQGALAWIWAKHGMAVPMPGFKSEAQVLELAAAMEKGPLDDRNYQMVETIISMIGTLG